MPWDRGTKAEQRERLDKSIEQLGKVMSGMRRYDDRLSNSVDQNGRSAWEAPVHEGYRLACCTCGLVHNMNFRIRKGQVEMQFQINRRATAAMRRKRYAGATDG